MGFEKERERAIGELMKYKAFIKNEMKVMLANIDQVVLDIDRADTILDFSRAYQSGGEFIVKHKKDSIEGFKKLKPKD